MRKYHTPFIHQIFFYQCALCLSPSPSPFGDPSSQHLTPGVKSPRSETLVVYTVCALGRLRLCGCMYNPIQLPCILNVKNVPKNALSMGFWQPHFQFLRPSLGQSTSEGGYCYWLYYSRWLLSEEMKRSPMNYLTVPDGKPKWPKLQRLGLGPLQSSGSTAVERPGKKRLKAYCTVLNGSKIGKSQERTYNCPRSEIRRTYSSWS